MRILFFILCCTVNLNLMAQSSIEGLTGIAIVKWLPPLPSVAEISLHFFTLLSD